MAENRQSAEKSESSLPEKEAPGSGVGGSSVRPLRTYRADVENVIGEKRLSLIGIAAKEMDRGQGEPPKEPRLKKLTALLPLIAGVILAAAGIGIASYAYLVSTRDAVEPAPAVSSIVPAEKAETFALDTKHPETILVELARKKDSLSLTLGSIEHLSLTDREKRPLTASGFLSLVGARAPGTLARALADEFMLGVHAFDGNQAFLVFTIDAYEQAFAGMLAWERDVSEDMAPLLGPAIRFEPAFGTTTPEALFKARVVKNRDVRVLPRGDGKIALLYAFPDRQTLVITTNENTFNEIMTRLTAPRIAP